MDGEHSTIFIPLNIIPCNVGLVCFKMHYNKLNLCGKSITLFQVPQNILVTASHL